MLMAARKLQGIGLVLLVLIFAMMLYPVSLKVAATRSELTRVEREIDRARDNIRYLESELAVRASMRQLEQWNAEAFGYSAPDAGQYLSSERQLASVPAAPKASPVAAVPTVAAAKPVVLAQVESGVRSDALPRMAPTRRREQLKMIEDQLLAESTLADLKREAAIEAAGGKPAR